MAINRISFLTCLLVILTILLASEYRALTIRFNQLPSSPIRPAPIAPAHSDRPVDPNHQAELDIILARPLFSEIRRPSPPVNASASAILPRLTGVVTNSSSKIAIFADSSNGKSVALVEGDPIGAYVVQSIAAGQATMSGPDGLQVLHPTFDIGHNNPRDVPKMEVSRNEPLAVTQVYKGPLLRVTR